MATTRIMPLHIGKGRTESRAISDIIDYVANPQKTDNGKLITSYGCDSRTADAEFLLAKRQYIAATGRVRGTDDVIAYHVRQSFRPGEITPEEANRLGIEFARRFTKGNHSFVVCTHIDKSHIHNHIIWSAVNTDCDRKFRNFWGSTRAVRRLSDTICIENGLSIVENPKPHGKSYNKWLGEQAKPSHREQLRVMIDRALEQKPADFDTLLKLLSEMGCEVSRRGKAIRLKAPGWKNVARMDDKLGAGYSETEIRAVLAGEKQHTPRKKSTVQPEPPKVNLLVDIQAKLQAGKGAGYARWAKVFNLKQMAQTVNFLTEHHLLDYTELEEKAVAATTHHNELSAQIKVTEKRMAEIAVLRTHIVNYAKTRETYVIIGCPMDKLTEEPRNTPLTDQLQVGESISFYKDGELVKTSTILAKAILVGTETETPTGTTAQAHIAADAPFVYLPDTVFKEIYDAPTLLTYGFNVEEALQPQMEEFLSSYVSENTSVAYTSTKLLKEQLDSVRSMILVIGGLIGCIMAFAGLINFTNMIITNIITRRHEFATMQSIGMTGKQLRRLTVYEGIYYAVGADIIGGAVAAILAVTVLKSALNGPSMWFFTLNITLVPVLVIGVLYLLLAAVIPLIVLHFFNKGTVVERLRTSE